MFSTAGGAEIGEAWLREARHGRTGVERPDMVGRGKVRQASRGLSRKGAERHDQAWQAWHGASGNCVAGRGMVGRGRRGVFWTGKERRGAVWQVWPVVEGFGGARHGRRGVAERGGVGQGRRGTEWRGQAG